MVNNYNPNGELRRNFLVPPFSILDSKKYYWNEQKRFWISKGIQSELGRDAGCNVEMTNENWEKYGRKPMPATSIFDPFLCEIVYKWFCTKNGTILDPFAGGSVRGIVANCLGYKYTGIDLSEKQIKANVEQGKKILPDNKPNWLIGDSDEVLDTLTDAYDLVFTCPPYHDLEVYSEDENDLSNLDYDLFIKKYESILTKSIDKLKPNRFFVIVVSDIRDKNGFYKGFLEDTVNIFLKNGLKKYNDIILAKPLGTLPIRANNMFRNRKIGKCHENVLVFYKGSVKEIQDNFNEIDSTPKKNEVPWW